AAMVNLTPAITRARFARRVHGFVGPSLLTRTAVRTPRPPPAIADHAAQQPILLWIDRWPRLSTRDRLRLKCERAECGYCAPHAPGVSDFLPLPGHVRLALWRSCQRMKSSDCGAVLEQRCFLRRSCCSSPEEIALVPRLSVFGPTLWFSGRTLPHETWCTCIMKWRTCTTYAFGYDGPLQPLVRRHTQAPLPPVLTDPYLAQPSWRYWDE